MVHGSAIYGLEKLTWRTLGPVERRLILGEVICYSEGGTRREKWFDAPKPSGLIVYPVLVLRPGEDLWNEPDAG
jgi:hypothetical protein